MAPKKAKAKAEPKAKAAVEEEKAEEAKPEAKPEAKEDTKEEAKDDTKEEAKEEAKEEEPKEKEGDAPADKRPKVKEGAVTLNLSDATLNAMAVNGGKALMPLTEGGMQFLLAGVRANAGMKAGRYMFEVRMLEYLNPIEQQGNARTPQPRSLLRLGVSTAGSSLLLADGASNCCFDSEGFFVHDKTRKRVAKKFMRDQVIAVLVNLDAASPNANTISLFVNGARACDPVALPENLRGQPLFPTVTYRNVSVQVNFGPVTCAPLPFTCTMLGGAATADLEMAAQAKAGKPEVVFPVGLPENGYFDWVDQFLENNPGYTELSARKIIEWAGKSGFMVPRQLGGTKDKPDAKLGVPDLDDGSIAKVLAAIAPTAQTNFVVAELKSNLLPADRADALLRFSANDFKRKAIVVMGEPEQAYKDWVHEKMLDEKKAKAEAEKKRKAAEEERKRLIEARKKKAEEDRKARLEAAAAAKRKREGTEEAEAEEGKAEEGAEGEAKEEEKEDKEEKKEDEKMEVEEAKEAEPEAPIELTEEEKQIVHRKTSQADMGEKELTKSYALFSLPTKAEGFEEVAFAWQKDKKCAELLKAFVMEKKMSSRAEDLMPGADFKEQYSKWQESLRHWRTRQAEFKDPAKRKAAQAKKVEEAKKKIEEEKQRLIDAGDEESAKALEESAVKEAEPMEIDVESLDPMSVEDITDLGNGEPLFANFTYEDWTLLVTRFELHLLVHSFKKDLNDPDRPGFGLKDLGFYFNKYYKKQWNFSQFGVKEFDDLVELLNNSVSLDADSGNLKADAEEGCPLEKFVQLTEDNRRERQRRIDAGDETARLKFTRPQAPKGGGKGAVTGGNGKGQPGGAYGKGAAPAYGQKRPAATMPYAANKQARTVYATGAGAYSRR